MIYHLSGRLLQSSPVGVVIDVGGVGYGLETPLSIQASLPEMGSPFSLWVYTHVREESIRLFGFELYIERTLFATLLTISGVGPKVALAMLSTLGMEGVRKAAVLEDAGMLTSVPGIGPRLAEKILVELKVKVPKWAEGEHSEGVPVQASALFEELPSLESQEAFQDVRSALENLGFKGKQVEPIIKKLKSDPGINQMNFQSILRKALALLAHKSKPEPQDLHQFF